MSIESRLCPGISVIIPTYQGVSQLPALLESLRVQTLEPEYFEVLFVLNGPDDGSRALLDRFQRDNQALNIRVLHSAQPGASVARNLGLASVARQFVTFLDDDDEIEPRFLELGLGSAAPNVIALLPIADVDDSRLVENTSLGIRIAALRGKTQLVRATAWALGFNACKVIPSEILLRYRYAEDLRSGEDVVFFAHLLQDPDLVFRVPSDFDQARYLRTQREGSVSRQARGFDFHVRQRLECIQRLRAIDVSTVCKPALASLGQAQFVFIKDYLKEHSDQVDDAIALAVACRVPGLDWASLRTERAKRLVISYCYPPYADTSANVAAKTIARRGEFVDVISANMSRVRSEDPSTQLIVEPFMIRHEELNVDASFASWPLIAHFGRKALRCAQKWAKNNGGYETLYSRALWSGSHVAAALVKLKFPHVQWEAEFSDPLRFGVDGQLREGKITRGAVTRAFKRVVASSAWPDVAIPSHFVLTELVTLLLADTVVFTNEHQAQVVLQPYPQDFQAFVEAKSTIRAHAKPERSLFALGTPRTDLAEGKINIAYFGNFYANRGIGEVVDALAALPSKQRNRFALHVYCNNPEEVDVLLFKTGINIDIRSYPYLSYLDFLASSDQFDVLLVNDVDLRNSVFDVNPFLPSKYADYAASTASVWGIVTPHSPLSQQPLDYESTVGDLESVKRVLYALLTGVA